MLSYKIYHFPNKKLFVKYFPEENVITLIPSKGLSSQDLNLFKSSIETALPVASSNKERTPQGPGISIKLQDGAQNVDEFLRAKGLLGGDQIGDASEDEQQQQSAPMPPQTESICLGDFYPEILYESTYRTGNYWNDLLRPAGVRSSNAITEKHILSLRRLYSRKPRSEGRNKVLRALDKAKSYFFRKLKKEKGIRAAVDFKSKFEQTGDLTSNDYGQDTKPQLDLQNPEFYGGATTEFDDLENQNPETELAIGDEEEPSEQDDVDEENYEIEEDPPSKNNIEDKEEEEDPYKAFDVLEFFNVGKSRARKKI